MDSVIDLVTRTHHGLTFDSLHFVTFCLIAVALVRWITHLGGKRWVLLALNTYFFFQVVSGTAPLIFLASLILFTYIFGEIRIRYSNYLPRILVPLVVTGYWALLFVVKDPVFACTKNPFQYYHVLFIGFSYIVFRCIHYVLDVEAFERRSLLTLINFILFFPTLFAGPLERFE